MMRIGNSRGGALSNGVVSGRRPAMVSGSHQPESDDGVAGGPRSLFSEDELPSNLQPWEQADQRDRLIAEVVLNRPLSTTFSYLVPDPLRDLLHAGARVEVPFGRGDRPMIGYCVGLHTQMPTGRALKSLLAVLDREPLIDAGLLDVTRWIAGRYLCGWGQVLEAVIPAGVKSQAGTRSVSLWAMAPAHRESWSQVKWPPKQQRVLMALAARAEPLPVDELSQLADCGIGPIHALRDRGVIVATRERRLQADYGAVPGDDLEIDHGARDIALNLEQQRAVDAVLKVVRASEHQTLLLHGVTGSGKTEVYIRCLQEVVEYGRQAIVLVPEISLTPQTIRRFRSRFPAIAVLHSHLTDAERHAQWKRIAEGEVQVVVGARSAVFAPVPHLGLIVIDEEHETSFKQDSTPRYHAREVARFRAQQAQVPLLLGSATPTLESWRRVQLRQDQLLSLPRRVAQRPLPPVVIVDVRDDPYIQQQQRAIGRALGTAMMSNLKLGGQAILFLNVRGFSPLILCRACGKPVRCPDCDLTLTWHRQHECALCHTCGHETPPPMNCPTASGPV